MIEPGETTVQCKARRLGASADEFGHCTEETYADFEPIPQAEGAKVKEGWGQVRAFVKTLDSYKQMTATYKPKG